MNDNNLAGRPLQELTDNIRKIDLAIDQLEKAKATFHAAIAERTKDKLAAALAETGKTQGSITVDIDGVKLNYELKPKITWDSKRLQAVAADMPWDKVEKIFSIKFSVKETTYKALTDDALIAALNEARTVEHTEPKITLA
jgi:4'-phosphopantetheinyl transferase EntD